LKLNIFSLNRIRTNELLRDTITFLTDKFAQSNKLFTISSPYGQTLFVQENIQQLNNYYIEDSITELSAREASRDSSVYGLADLAGYRPSRAVAAMGQVSLRVKPSVTAEIVGNVVNIPNYTRLKCINNNASFIVELTRDDIKLDVSSSSNTNINVTQGYVEDQILDKGYGTPYASYAVNFPKNYHIDNKWVKVYVNNVIQPLYDNLLKVPAGSPGCMVKSGITSGIDIFFGNGKFGSYPQLGAEVKVEYLVTDGYSGNVNSSNPDDVQWEFSETGYDAVGNEVDLNEVFDITTVVIPNFGSNPEPIELTRLMLSKSNDRLMTETDYELLLRRMQVFSMVRVFRDSTNDRVFNMFLIPDINVLISGNMDYFSIPLDKFTMSEKKKNELLRYMEKMGTKTISSDIKAIDPIISKYILNITIIKIGDHDDNNIRKDAISAISNYFLTTSRQDRIPRSDIIRILEDVEGVDSVNVRVVSEKNEISKKKNINNPDIGVDDMNDIIISKNELAVIRGGWGDRYGNHYDTTYRTDGGIGAVNIIIKK
jgi:hypothetical protein